MVVGSLPTRPASQATTNTSPAKSPPRSSMPTSGGDDEPQDRWDGGERHERARVDWESTVYLVLQVVSDSFRRRGRSAVVAGQPDVGRHALGLGVVGSLEVAPSAREGSRYRGRHPGSLERTCEPN